MDSELKKMLEKILSSVKSLDDRVSHLELRAPATSETPVASPPDRKLSIKEFIISKAPANGVQTTLTVAYYLENHDGVTPFNTADLERGFRAARETVPTNINDKVNMCVKNGFLMEEKAKKENTKAWVLTNTGEETVRAGFGRGFAPSQPSATTRQVAPLIADDGGDVGLFSRFDHGRPSDNALLIAAHLFQEFGSEPFTVEEVKAIAANVGITVPERIDMTYRAAQKNNKQLFVSTGRGKFKPTVHGETFLRATYEVKKGTRKHEGGEG